MENTLSSKIEIVKKLLHTKVEDNIETTKREIKEVPKEDWDKIFEFVSDILDDDCDYEASYSKGITCDINDDLAWINFNDLIEYLEDRQKDLEIEKEMEENEYITNKDILPILNKYKGYVY